MPFGHIKRLLSNDYTLIAKKKNNKKRIEICETGKNCTLTKLRFTNIPSNYVAFKMDSEDYSPICKIFCVNGYTVHKRLDCILFFRHPNFGNIGILCDMKSYNASDFNPKIKSVIPFIKYMDAILDEFESTSIRDFTFMSVLCKRREYPKSCISPMSPHVELCEDGRLNKLIITTNNSFLTVDIDELLSYLKDFSILRTLY